MPRIEVKAKCFNPYDNSNTPTLDLLLNGIHYVSSFLSHEEPALFSETARDCDLVKSNLYWWPPISASKINFLIFRVRSARINSTIRCAQCFTCLFDIVQLNFLPRVFCLGDLPWTPQRWLRIWIEQQWDWGCNQHAPHSEKYQQRNRLHNRLFL